MLLLHPTIEGAQNMIRSALGKVAWGGMTVSMVFGLALILALVLGVATMALGANGDFFKVGRVNVASAVSTLDKSGAGPALRLLVGSGAPLTVNSSTKVANLNADKIDGRDFSAFGAQQVIDQEAGPLPVEGTFTSRGGTLIVSVSGSGYRGTGSSQLEGKIAMDVRVDGGLQGFLVGYTNERNSHKAFVSEDLVVRGFPAGEHTVTLGRVYAAVVCNTPNETKDAPCTTTDANDFFSVTVTEIPD